MLSNINMLGIIKSNSESTTNEIYGDLSKFKIIRTTMIENTSIQV